MWRPKLSAIIAAQLSIIELDILAEYYRSDSQHSSRGGCMFKNLPKTLWKVLLVSVFIGGILLQATQIAAKTNSDSTAKSVASPTPIPTQYKFFLPILSSSPQVKLSSAWTADSNGNPKTTFVPGETIRFYTTGFNNSGSTAPAGFTWYEEGPCGSKTLSIETVNVSVDGWTRYKTSVVPDCIGIYTFTLNISYEGQIASYTTAFVVNHPSVVVSSTRQAFDRCNIPTTSQMQKWWTNSPYYGVNLYIGGISRGCANFGLNEFWVHIVSQQGWELIPTWVGPQAPCSPFKYRMSSNAITAYQEGRMEASAAASAAASLGLSKDRVIYYDLEGYASATLPCRSTVQSFLMGWTERLHELGVWSGVYGAAYSSYMNDWVSISPPPDYVWIASWYRSYFDPNASVWGVKNLSDSLWSNHQRIRQYAGDHVETWGGISFTIDSNIADGAVTKLPETVSPSSNAIVPEPTANSAQLREMQQVSPEQGWAIQGQQIWWTGDGGSKWKDITPPPARSNDLLAAQFLDEYQGWLLVQNPETNELTIFRTKDGGAGWQPFPVETSTSGLDPHLQGAYVNFIDPQTGWVALKHVSSSNFSLGSLYGTVDGGQTWSKLSLPIGGPIYFIDSTRGWVAGGASGNELYVTSNGGKTWETQGLPLNLENETGLLFPGLPSFSDGRTGYLSLTIADPENPRVEVFISENAGASWSPYTAFPLDPEVLPGSQIPLEILDQGQLYVASPGPAQLFSLGPSTTETLPVSAASLPGNVLNMDFSQPSSGWVQVQAGECQGYKPKPGESIPPGQSLLNCEMQSLLYKTTDGGLTWTQINP